MSAKVGVVVFAMLATMSLQGTAQDLPSGIRTAPALAPVGPGPVPLPVQGFAWPAYRDFRRPAMVSEFADGRSLASVQRFVGRPRARRYTLRRAHPIYLPLIVTDVLLTEPPDLTVEDALGAYRIKPAYLFTVDSGHVALVRGGPF